MLTTVTPAHLVYRVRVDRIHASQALVAVCTVSRALGVRQMIERYEKLIAPITVFSAKILSKL